jgi:hypothetical protein
MYNILNSENIQKCTTVIAAYPHNKVHNKPSNIHNFTTPSTTRSMRTVIEPYANEGEILPCMCTSAVVMSPVLIKVLANCIVLMVSCIFTECTEIAKITLH